MKKIIFITAIFLSLSGNAYSQGNEIDAFTLSNTELGGTARSMSMGGAFGALGGDLSVISTNPAGLGIYRSSEISGTLDFSSVNTSTNWNGMGVDRDKTRFSPTNFGFQLYYPTRSGSIRNWNLGFSYNRLKNFKRTYRMQNNGQKYSMANYAAWRASNAFGAGNGISSEDIAYIKDEYDPYENADLSGQWLPVLGYESGYFENFVGPDGQYQSAFGKWTENETVWNTYSPNEATLIVNESGQIDEYNIGFGMNISNFIFLGASASITTIDYRYRSMYDELFYNDNDSRNDDYLYLDNILNTEGTAVSLNLGAIVNLQRLRLGAAYNSPRMYYMTDYFDAYAGSYIQANEDKEWSGYTPEGIYSEYKFSSPGKWIFSGAYILGHSALISMDYEIVNYGDMFYEDRSTGEQNYMANDYIDEDYTMSHTLKVGTEVKVTPQFAVRAGYMMQTSPMQEELVNNDVEVLPAGTLPHFTTTSKPTNYYTVGFGYRFTPNFHIDIACVYRYNSSNAYAFSNTNGGEDEVFPVTPASLKTKTTRLAMTLGYKF